MFNEERICPKCKYKSLSCEGLEWVCMNPMCNYKEQILDDWDEI